MSEATTAPIDPRQFRDVMGRFATGVTVVTAERAGTLRGMTANAFSSVSLDPPLMLVCIDEHASIYPLFEEGATFAVNILAREQEDVSRSFAERGEKAEVMGGFPFRTAPHGSPILEGVMAWMECRVRHRYVGGDHIIVVGQIADLALERPDAEPLLFFSGQYRSIEQAT